MGGVVHTHATGATSAYTPCIALLHVVVFVDYLPGTAETLDVSNEGETLGFPRKEQEFHPCCVRLVKRNGQNECLVDGSKQKPS